MSYQDLYGVVPYLVSPIDQKTGEVKVDVLQRLSKNLIEEGVHGLCPLGSTGEVHYLTWQQKRRIVETVVEVSDGRVPVLPGVSAYATKDAIEQINYFEKLGVDGVVLILNTYFSLSQNDILNFYTEVANSVSCSIVLYNNPKFSNTDLTPDIVSELASIPNIKYFKDATGNTGRLLSIINNAGDNIKIFSASAHIPLFVMKLGGVGWMGGPVCVSPKKAIQLYELAYSEHWDEALKIQNQLWRINEIFEGYSLAPCIKAILEIQGYNVGDPISPLKSLNNDEKSVVQDVLNHIS